MIFGKDFPSGFESCQHSLIDTRQRLVLFHVSILYWLWELSNSASLLLLWFSEKEQCSLLKLYSYISYEHEKSPNRVCDIEHAFDLITFPELCFAYPVVLYSKGIWVEMPFNHFVLWKPLHIRTKATFPPSPGYPSTLQENSHPQIPRPIPQHFHSINRQLVIPIPFPSQNNIHRQILTIPPKLPWFSLRHGENCGTQPRLFPVAFSFGRAGYLQDLSAWGFRNGVQRSKWRNLDQSWRYWVQKMWDLDRRPSRIVLWSVY